MSLNVETRNYHSYVRTLYGSFQNVPSLDEDETPAGVTKQPPTNITETEKYYEVKMAVPGYSRSAFKISVDEDVLKITASPDLGVDCIRRIIKEEFCLEAFSCTLLLPENVNKVSYDYHKGILTVRVKKG